VDGKRTHRPRLFAARIRGNSMIERDVLDGDFVIIQHSDFAYPEYGKIVVVEKAWRGGRYGSLDSETSGPRSTFIVRPK
jgi:phage repressor protein C with HTH and peptisase S24 domain